MRTENQLIAAASHLAGQAGRVPAATPEPQVMKADEVVMRATIHITRAATGKVETYEITGIVPKEQ